MDVLGKERGGISLRLPDLKYLPGLTRGPGAMRNETLRLSKCGTERRDHSVVPFLRLARNVCGHKNGHVSTPSASGETSGTSSRGCVRPVRRGEAAGVVR